jgi:hypothetical protein
VDAKVYEEKITKKRYCPLEDKANMKITTPKLAKSITSKYLNMSAKKVKRDFSENHNIDISTNTVRNVIHRVENINKNIEIDFEMSEEIIKNKDKITTITFSLDGTCIPVETKGYREAMVGAISFYDKNIKKIDTIYIAEAPEHGKETFKKKFIKEIENIKKFIPENTKIIGLADGAPENWKFFEPYIDIEILDFFHASEYLTKVSKCIDEDKEKQKEWLDKSCKKLKNNENSAEELLEEMKKINKNKLSDNNEEELKTSITYFENHKHQMNYSQAINDKIPIGSGVIEGACKSIVKERICISGARWGIFGSKSILDLKAINQTNGRWEQLWRKIA